MKDENMYLANLSFLLNYENGISKDEIESEIFKVALQQKETIHYDRALGGGFQDLEQEPANIASAIKFTCDLIESVYRVNQEKNNNPYIVVGYSDITIQDETTKTSGEYLVNVQYKLLQDIRNTGNIG